MGVLERPDLTVMDRRIARSHLIMSAAPSQMLDESRVAATGTELSVVIPANA